MKSVHPALLSLVFCLISDISAAQYPMPDTSIIPELRQIDSMYRTFGVLRGTVAQVVEGRDTFFELRLWGTEFDGSGYNLSQPETMLELAEKEDIDTPTLFNIIGLMKSVGALRLEQSGVGDCHDCSSKIVVERKLRKERYFLIAGANHRCLWKYCHWVSGKNLDVYRHTDRVFEISRKVPYRISEEKQIRAWYNGDFRFRKGRTKVWTGPLRFPKCRL